MQKRTLLTGTAKQLLDNHPAGEERRFVSPSDSLKAAAETLLDNRMGAITVKSEGKVVGILSERDYMKATVKGADPEKALVQDVMTVAADMISVESSATTGKVIKIMNDNHIRHVPAFDNGNFVGLLTIRDVVKKVAEESELEIQRMQDYVAGGY